MATKWRSWRAGEPIRDQIRNTERGIETAANHQHEMQMRNQLNRLKEDLARTVPPPFESNAQADAARQRLSMAEAAMREGCPSKGIRPMPSRMAVDESTRGAINEVLHFQDKWGKHTLDAEGRVVRAKGGYGLKFERIDLRNRLALHDGDREEQPGQESFRPDGAAEPLMDRQRAVYGAPQVSDERAAELWPDSFTAKRLEREKELERQLDEMHELVKAQQEALEDLRERGRKRQFARKPIEIQGTRYKSIEAARKALTVGKGRMPRAKFEELVQEAKDKGLCGPALEAGTEAPDAAAQV